MQSSPEPVTVLDASAVLTLLVPHEGRLRAGDALARLLFFALDLSFTEPDRLMAQQALAWAERLGQSKAYDAFYVALAEAVDGVLWTEDHRLLNRCRQLGLDWVQAMG